MPKKRFLLFLAAISVIAVSIIIYFSIDQKNVKKKEAEANKPANLEAIELVDNSCPNCFKMFNLTNVLKEKNIIFENIREVDINSDEGGILKEQYLITKVPIMIITGEIGKDQEFLDYWKGYGQVKESALISDVYPPYRDLKTNQIIGLVDLTIIYDETCTECYNTKKHLDFLKAEGLEPVSIKKLNITEKEAQELIDKYSITKVPTILLSKEASYYKVLTEHWKDVGKIAEDGSYVFTAPEKIGTYKDLSTNEIKKVEIKS